MPEMGFVEGGYDSPTDTALDRPFLNARQRYTHVVEDGLTAVTGGGIECALDGGTFEIGMYDVTDGVLGAPRVFKETITLPERPNSGGTGYEFGTYTFDIDSVPLREYVGRELAVAVRHDRVRPRGQNCSDRFRAEHGWGFSTGERTAPLSDTWGEKLQESGSLISAALFVEPTASPAGKARTVVGGDRFDTLAQTVFAAFPDVTPNEGMIVEYDEQTAGGAPVTVLPNGVVRTGPGSTSTDSFDVRLRKTDGTWHGPKTLTLTERSIAVSVPDIKLSGTFRIEVDAVGAERITVGELWTDWVVTSIEADGGTVQEITPPATPEDGTITLTWDSPQDVAPVVHVEPNANTTPDPKYVGGEYVLEVRLDGGRARSSASPSIER